MRCTAMALAAALLPAGGLAAVQCPDGAPPPCRSARAAAAPAPARAPDPHGVAVLYFTDMSRDTTAAVIADGLTEEIIARLTQVTGLRVPSRFATIRYRGRGAADPRLVGRELGMRYVLDGSLRRTGQRLRVVLALSDATNGLNVWSHVYERPIDDIFTIQDSVAIGVAERVLGRLTAGERARLAPAAASVNVAAYEAYLRGSAAIRERTAAAATAAVAQYRRAIALDPEFARAWAGLAQALSLAQDWGWSLADISPDSVQPLAVQAAERALALDSTSAAAWLAAAMAERSVDPQRGLASLVRAVSLDSSSVEALHQLAWGYLASGDLASATAAERRVIARDPYYAYAYAGLANMLGLAQRPGDAAAVATQGLAVDSTHAPLYSELADAALQLGDAAAARRAADRAQELGSDPLGARLQRALASLVAGDTVTARREAVVIDGILAVESARVPGALAFVRAGFLSGLYARLGDVDGAVRWAGRSPRFYASYFAWHWMWAPVRDDPRFQRFLASRRS